MPLRAPGRTSPRPAGNVCAKVHANHTPVMRLQRLKIAERLRLLEHAERIWLVGNRHVDGVSRDELQEDAGIGPPLCSCPVECWKRGP